MAPNPEQEDQEAGLELGEGRAGKNERIHGHDLLPDHPRPGRSAAQSKGPPTTTCRAAGRAAGKTGGRSAKDDTKRPGFQGTSRSDPFASKAGSGLVTVQEARQEVLGLLLLTPTSART